MKTRVTVTLDPGVAKGLRKEAKKERRSVSFLVNEFCKDFLKSRA